MIQVSDEAKKHIESDTRTFQARLMYNKAQIPGEIRSLTVNKGSCGSSEFSPGAVFSSYIDVTIDGCTQKLEGKELQLQIGTIMEESIEWTVIGLFTVEKPSTSVYSTTFSALGRISAKMGGLYTPTIEFPASVKTVLTDIESNLGIKIDIGALNTSILIKTKPSGYMYREVLGYIAGLYFGYATEAADGTILIRQFKNTATTSTNGDRTTSLPTFQDLDAKVTGVKVVVGTEADDNGNNNEIAYQKGTVNVAVSNPLMTQEIFDQYAGTLIGYQYRPATINITLGDFRLEASDTLKVLDVKNAEYTVPCMSVVHSFDGGIQTTITAPAIKNTEDAQAFRGPLSQAVSVMQAQLLIVGTIAAKAITADQADIRYANIDFSNINEAAIKKMFSETGIIKDLTIEDGKVTGELVGVTIKGNLIEGETIAADKLVIKGEDGLYYKLNVNALGETTAKTDPKYQSGLDGSVLVKKSIVAEKIAVDDLVAFGATIGGVNIGNGSIYSGVKSSVSNTTTGFYLGKDGQCVFGNSTNFMKLFKSGSTWKLAFSGALEAASGTFKGELEAASGTFEGTVKASGIQFNGTSDYMKGSGKVWIATGGALADNDMYMSDNSASKNYAYGNIVNNYPGLRVFGNIINSSNDINYLATHTWDGNAIGFGVGSGGENRGLFDYKPNGSNNWIIYRSGNTTYTNTSSDSRCKEDRGEIPDEEAIAMLNGIVPKNFVYQDGCEVRVIQNGFMAQNVRDVLKENGIGYRPYLLIDEDNYDLYTPEEEVTYGLDYSKFVPLLLKGWQMHERQISDLEAQIAELKKGLEDGNTD